MAALTASIFGALGLGLLTACAPQSGLRDASAPISSTTRFDTARFAGEWRVVARMAAPGENAPDRPERFILTQQGQGFAVKHALGVCGDGECVFRQEETAARVTGPGRLRMPLGGSTAELWVLWVDADYRTAAIGTPSGAFGWIMEKGAHAPGADRMNAAREILEWAGYDLTRLVEVTK